MTITVINAITAISTGGGSGSVTNVTFTGDGTVLSSTPSAAVTSTGTLTAALANATALSLLGNGTGSSAAPTYETSPVVSGSYTGASFIPNGSTVPINGMYLSAANTLDFSTNSTKQLEIDSTGNAVLGSVSESASLTINSSGSPQLNIASPFVFGAAFQLSSTSVPDTWQFNVSGSGGGGGTFVVANITKSCNPMALYRGTTGNDVDLHLLSGGVIGLCSQSQFANNSLRSDTAISRISANVMAIGNGTSGDVSGTLSFTTLTLGGKTNKYNNISTAGWGTPAIYGSGRTTAQIAANASIAAYTVGAADGSFIISANVNITASTTFSFTVTCTYTDETNTSRVLTLIFSQFTGTLLTAITNVQGVGAYEGVPVHIRCKASTSITIATAAGGTYTSVTYNAEAVITQIA